MIRRARSTDGKTVYRFDTGLQIGAGNLYAIVGMTAAGLVLAAVSAGIGYSEASFFDVLLPLYGNTLSDDQEYALWTVRLPRIALGFLVGWAVAVSGAVLQSIARNPLADPGLFGFSQGSMTAIMLLLVLAPATSKGLIVVAALAGGLFVVGLLLWLVGAGSASGLSIILAGIALESVLSSISSVLLLYLPTEVSISLSEWLAGSLFQANWTMVATFSPLLLLSIAGIVLLGRATAPLDLGTEMAMALGEPVRWSRPILLIFAVLLSSAAVSAVGPLAFLGILAPHIAGFMSPAVSRARLVLSGLVGGILVVAADSLTRGAGGVLPLPLGLALTVVGVPLFIIALRIQSLRRQQLH